MCPLVINSLINKIIIILYLNVYIEITQKSCIMNFQVSTYPISSSSSLCFLFFFIYVGTYSVGKAQFCTVCPDGKFCPSTTTATETDCALGTFSSGGQERCTPCPSGWKCPDSNGIGNAKCPPVSAWGPLKSHWLTLVHRLNFHFPA